MLRTGGEIADDKDGVTSFPDPTAHITNTWPILAAWRWLVTLPSREPLLSRDVDGHSAAAVSQECAWDLGHRAILPSVLGRALCQREPPPDLEEYSVWRHTEQTTREAEQLQHRHDHIRPAVKCVTLLLLGLRRIRVEYARRIEAWKQTQLIMEQLRVPEAVPFQAPLADDERMPSILDAWFGTPRGLATARELRWLAPALSVLAARIKAEVPACRLSPHSIRVCAATHRVPITLNGQPNWADVRPSEEMQMALRTPCICRPARQEDISCCWTCGGAQLPPEVQPRPCPYTATAAMGDPDAATVAALFISWGNVLGTAEPTAATKRALWMRFACALDCWGIWRSALLAAPRRPARTPLPPGNLLTHLIQVSQQCQAGAGANTFHARSSDRQRVRRWCLRALPRDWTAFPDILQQAERSLTEVANVAELLQDGLRHWHRRGTRTPK